MPLRDVPADSAGDSRGGERRQGMSAVQTLPVSRRGFLGRMFSAGALVIAAPVLSPALRAQQASRTGAHNIWQPNVYLGIEPDGTVKIVAHRSEMGTGCKTGLPMIV